MDPWDAARGGMVNIDDITDTKHKPMVEVKPFTNDHRPLADLVRETPQKAGVHRVVDSQLNAMPDSDARALLVLRGTGSGTNHVVNHGLQWSVKRQILLTLVRQLLTKEKSRVFGLP